MRIRIIKTSDPLKDTAVLALRDTLRSGTLTPGGPVRERKLRRIVAKSIKGVRKRRDAWVIKDTKRLHRAQLGPKDLRVPLKRIEGARAEADADFFALVRRAADNIREYQESILLRDPPPLHRGGRELAVRYTPIRRAGVYVPGGTAVLCSSLLMTVVPAQVAGVDQIAVVSPPRSDGTMSLDILAAAGELGLDELYGVSGVAGLAALAFGTESIRKVDKIVGPGSAFIAEAKRQLFGVVGIDILAGPSEVLIIADDTAQADLVAADMLAQVEHDPGSAILLTPSERLGEQVADKIESMVGGLDRADAIQAAIDAYSAVIVVDDIEAACAVANEFAPEHLQIMTRDDDGVLKRVRNAGAIFVGRDTPVPLGDYYAGPSHVLPTGGAARFSGPLSCNDFLKASSVVRYDEASLAEDAADVIDFASREGLSAHAAAVRGRLPRQ